MILITRLICLLFLSVCLPCAGLAQTLTLDERGATSIAELFDIGAGATGGESSAAVPWPIDILLQRDHDAVLAEALRRIDLADNGPYGDAFCIKLLLALSPPQLDTLLRRNFAALDPGGQFEVLLYARTTLDPGYAPQFQAALESLATASVDSATAVLAASYQAVVGDPALHRALTDYVASHPQEASSQPRRLSLNGYPYSDVATQRIDDVDRVFDLALETGAFNTSLQDRRMSETEQAALQKIRQQLLQPLRQSPAVPALSLPLLLEALQEHFPGLSFEHIASSLDAVSTDSTINWTGISLVELFAQLCNQLNLSITGSSIRDNAWSVVEQNKYGYGLSNSCYAQQGFLVTLNTSYRDSNAALLGGRVPLTIKATSASPWFNLTPQHFILETVQFSNPSLGASDVLHQPGETLLQLDLGDRNPATLGNLTFSGTLRIMVPATLMQTRYNLLDTSNITDQQGARRLSYHDDGDNIQMHWGFTTQPVGFGRLKPFFHDLGLVDFQDSEGNRTRIRSTGSLSTDGLTGNSISTRHTYLRSELPGSLTWTYAPTVEFIEIPVIFSEVALIPQQSDEDPSTDEERVIIRVR